MVVLGLDETCCVAYAEGVKHRSPGPAHVSATNVSAALGGESIQDIGRASDVAMERILPRPKRARSAGGFGNQIRPAERHAPDRGRIPRGIDCVGWIPHGPIGAAQESMAARGNACRSASLAIESANRCHPTIFGLLATNHCAENDAIHYFRASGLPWKLLPDEASSLCSGDARTNSTQHRWLITVGDSIAPTTESAS